MTDIERYEANAALIARLRNEIPALLDVVEAAAWVSEVQAHHNIKCPVPDCDSEGCITDVDPYNGQQMAVQCEYCVARDELSKALAKLVPE